MEKLQQVYLVIFRKHCENVHLLQKFCKCANRREGERETERERQKERKPMIMDSE